MGLGGDGDEVDAILNVEQQFDVQLDYSDAQYWTTVGDVFASLQKALPPEQARRDDIWTAFAEAISCETGVDPSQVVPETLLLAKGGFDWRALIILASMIGLALVFIGR
mgnify:FL=1